MKEMRYNQVKGPKALFVLQEQIFLEGKSLPTETECILYWNTLVY